MLKLLVAFQLLITSHNFGFAAPIELTQEAIDLTQSSLVVDGHNDLPWALRSAGDYDLTRYDLRQHQSRFDTDIPRLREGGMGAQFWSVYVPASTMNWGVAYTRTMEQIDLVHRMVEKYPEDFHLALSTSDIDEARSLGKIASLIGIEGGHSIENSLDKLRRLYAAGARYMTITHSKSLSWADSATDRARANGLSDFGRSVIAEMNQIGMLVDISHVSTKAMHDILDITTAPVIASHSSARKINSHSRNVPDDVLRRVAENGGVIMVNFYSAYVVPRTEYNFAELMHAGCNHEQTFPAPIDFSFNPGYLSTEQVARGDVDTVVDHIEHIIRVAGIDHVGLGSDFDGVPNLPDQLDDVAKFPYITQSLMNRGYSVEQIKKVLGENLYRVFQKVEEVAGHHQ